MPTAYSGREMLRLNRPFARIPRNALLKDRKEDGAAYRIRTCDPRITNAMLYQLS